MMGAAALMLACATSVAAETGSGMAPLICLLTTDCAGTPDCTPDTYTVEIAPADHAPGLWFTYPGRALAARDITPSDTPLILLHAPGGEENVMLTVFPTGDAIHIRQSYLPDRGPRQETAFGQCEGL